MNTTRRLVANGVVAVIVVFTVAGMLSNTAAEAGSGGDGLAGKVAAVFTLQPAAPNPNLNPVNPDTRGRRRRRHPGAAAPTPTTTNSNSNSSGNDNFSNDNFSFDNGNFSDLLNLLNRNDNFAQPTVALPAVSLPQTSGPATSSPDSLETVTLDNAGVTAQIGPTTLSGAASSSLPAGMHVVRAFQLTTSPPGSIASATIVIHYSDADAGASGPTSLQMRYYSSSIGFWVPVAAVVDQGGHTLTIRGLPVSVIAQPIQFAMLAPD